MFLGYKGQFGSTAGDAYLPMIDARRMEVYTAVYDHNAALVKATSAEIIDVDYFNELLQNYHRVHLFGSGADKFEDLFSASDRVNVLSGFNVSATFLSTLAFDKFQRQEFEDVAYFEPFYLKDFVVTTAKKKVGLL